MSGEVLAELGFSDPRYFYLREFQDSHAHALLRGFPEVDEDAEEFVPTQLVIDFLFTGVVRVSCWRDFGGFEIRRATEAERAAIITRIGKIRDDDVVYLLESGTAESYIIAKRVYWAEFDMPPGEQSPLASEDPGYRAAYPPVDGTVRRA